MKIALVHDELVRRGGAEQFTKILTHAFPNVPLYTSCYNSQHTYPEFEKINIKTSWLNHFIHDEKNLKKFFFPFSFWAMGSIDLEEYDVIFISTTTYAKFIKPRKDAIVIAFCHYPFRLAWFPESYSQFNRSKGLKKTCFNIFIKYLKKLDFKASKRIDWYITNTPNIKEIIERCYQPKNDVEVIFSSIVCDNFYVSEKPSKDYYLLVSRIEPYKKVDLVIETFNKLPNKKLIIVGKGSQKENCIKIANKNITFKEGITTKELSKLYSNCKAFIFPQEEDFGLTPIEANASGRPVIAYGKGGVLYTTIPYTTDEKKCTAIYFNEQKEEYITKAIEMCEKLEFDSGFIREHALKFDESVFIDKIRQYIKNKYYQHQNKKNNDIKK